MLYQILVHFIKDVLKNRNLKFPQTIYIMGNLFEANSVWSKFEMGIFNDV